MVLAEGGAHLPPQEVQRRRSVQGVGSSLEEEVATTPVFLPGQPRGQRSLAGCSPWGHKSQAGLGH